MSIKKQRYIKTKHSGIHHDTKSGNYLARKWFDGKAYSKSLPTLKAALKWRNNFHPLIEEGGKTISVVEKLKNDLLSNTNVSEVNSFNLFASKCFGDVDNGVEIIQEIISEPNGVKKRYTVKSAWDKYCDDYLTTIEEYSAHTAKKKAANLLPDLYSFKMVHLNPELIELLVKKKVKEIKESKNERHSRRESFRLELKVLSAFCNWYKSRCDYKFTNPISKHHYALGVIKKKVKSKDAKMNEVQVRQFFDAFDSQFWKDFAEWHFYTDGRVQEVAGIQVESIKILEERAEIRDVAVWGDDKKFSYLKEIPKNGEERDIFMNAKLIEIATRRLSLKESLKCNFSRRSNGKLLNFFFHIDGQPITYRQVQYQYNKTLKKAGLSELFSATKIMRKAAANIVRKTKGLDSAQNYGGWKSRAVVEKHYTDLNFDENKEIAKDLQDLIESCDPNCNVIKLKR